MTTYSVNTSDILGDIYKRTSITIGNSTPTIDDDVLVTVTVKDIYGDPIENETVNIECIKGAFTELNGVTITDTQSVQGTTDSAGQVFATYSAVDWGLDKITSNEASEPIMIDGWREVWSNNGNTIKTLINGEFGMVVVSNHTNFSIPNSWKDGYSYDITNGNKPSVLAMGLLSGGVAEFRINAQGIISFRSLTDSTIPATATLTGSLIYKLGGS